MRLTMKTLRNGIVGMALMLSTVPPALAATVNPRDCLEILQTAYNAGTYAGDGDYVIEPVRGKPFTVYCANMSTTSWNPREYLTLARTGGDFNFSQFTAGGFVGGTSTRTSYTRIRIDPKTLLIEIGDTTFATTTGEITWGGTAIGTPPNAFGAALDCSGSGVATGVGNIDLTGTSFIVADEFYSHGYASTGTVTFDGRTVALAWNQPGAVVTGRVVDLTGGGYCGGAGPRGHNSEFNRWFFASAGLALQLQWVSP